MSIHAKLMKARLMLHGKRLEKTGHNKFAGYTYFELGDFLPAVQEIFASLELCGIVSYTAELAKLTITDIEKPSEYIEITSPMGSAALKGCHEVQNIGAVETYQRRYLWVTAMEIVEHDALDAVTGKDAPASAKSITQDEWDRLPIADQKRLQVLVDKVRAAYDAQGAEAGARAWSALNLDATEKVAAWNRFSSTERSAMKAANQKKAA